MLDADSILVVQIRLLKENLCKISFPAFLLTLVLISLGIHGINSTLLIIGLLLTLAKIGIYILPGFFLKLKIIFTNMHQFILVFIILSCLDGFIYGWALWIAMGLPNDSMKLLFISLIAGISGLYLFSLIPVLPVYIAFIVPEIAIIAFKFWTFKTPSFLALSIASTIYLGVLIIQGRIGSNLIRKNIILSSDNAELEEKLRLETKISEAARNESEITLLAAISHDLRQPIHAQRLFLETLAQTKLDEIQQELIENARTACLNSLELINNFFDYSRIESGAIEPKIQTFWLQPLLNKIEKEFSSEADAKGLQYRSRETDLAVRSDPVLVEMIMRNLVSNAIRYTDRGGILIAFRKRQNHALLEVWDTGIGIDPSHQKEIFLEFHQLNSSETDPNSNKGLGLGLAIVRTLATKLDYCLSLSSVTGQGSVFKIEIPLAETLHTAY